MPQSISINSDRLTRAGIFRSPPTIVNKRKEFVANVSRILFVFVGYYIGSQIGFALTFRPYAVSTLWPPNAILMGALLISPTRLWPVLLIAALPAHLAVQLGSEVPPIMVICWFLSNICEALIGASLIRRFLKTPASLETLKQILFFLFFVAFLGPFLSSFLDAGFVKWNHWGAQNYWHVWRMRFFSNVLAELTLVPVILSWSRIDFSGFKTIGLTRYIELILLLLGLSFVTFIVLNHPRAELSPLWVYLPVPFLLWAATRFEFNVLSIAIVMVAFMSIWGAVHGAGPFHQEDPVENTFSIQIFLIVFSVPLLLFASVLQERRNTRELALQDEERLRLALSAAKMATWDLHIATNQITWLQQYQQLGVAESCLNLESFLKILHPEDRRIVSNAIHRTIREGGTYEVEFRIMVSQDEVLWQLGKGEAILDERGQPVRILGVNVDITERKRAEELRRQAEVSAQIHRQELYHLSRVSMLAELSGTVAHELNQPLTAILSNAQAAQRYLQKETVDIPEVRAIIQAVIDQDRRAGDVIKRLRTLLKKGEVEMRPMNLNHVIQEVVGLLHSEFITHNVVVSTEFCDRLPKHQGDRVQLQQVLLNLILNALEAMKTVESRYRELKIKSSVENSNIQLSISDRGEGIPQDKLDHVFEPFYTTKEHGLGLGLAISRAIVVAHGGQLKVENNADRGATFLLMLPQS